MRSDRLYRLLLRLYPAAFYAEFAVPMAQLFHDQLRDASRGGALALWIFWLRTLADLLVTVVREHLERNDIMRRTVLMAAALLVGLGIGWIDIHNDEIWAGLLLLLSATFLFGFVEPRTAWRSGLLIGLGLPLMHLLAVPLNIVAPCAPGDVCPTPSLGGALKMLLVLVPALVGSYVGVGIQALSELDRRNVIWWIGSAMVGLVVGLLSLRTRPVGNVILILGLLSLLAGFSRPSGVWRWALVLGLVVGAFHGWGELIQNPPQLLLKWFIVDIVPAFAGAYLGFALSRLLDRYLPPAEAAAQPQPSAMG